MALVASSLGHAGADFPTSTGHFVTVPIFDLNGRPEDAGSMAACLARNWAATVSYYDCPSGFHDLVSYTTDRDFYGNPFQLPTVTRTCNNGGSNGVAQTHCAETSGKCPEGSVLVGDHLAPNGYFVAACRCTAGDFDGASCVRPVGGDLRKSKEYACAGVGNPVFPETGEKHEVISVYQASAAGDLRFDFFYTNLPMLQGPVTNKTVGFLSHTYGSKLELIYPGGAGLARATAHRAKGSSVYFTFNASNSSFSPQIGSNYRLSGEFAPDGKPTRLLLTTPDESVEEYDSAGRLVSITNRAGRITTVVRSDGLGGRIPAAATACNGVSGGNTPPSDAIWCVVDHYGRQLNFSYDANERVALLQDFAGGIHQFTYNPQGSLTSVKHPDNSVRNYVYGEPALAGGEGRWWLLTGIVDELGNRYASFGYNAAGAAISTEHAGATNKFSIATNTAFQQISVTDPLGSQRVHQFSTILGVLRPTGVSQPGGSGCGPASSAITYDAQGNVASRRDFNGNLTCYTYDLTRNLETKRVEALSGSGTCSAPVTTSSTRTVSTQWHASLRLPLKVAEPLKLTTYTYDSKGNVLTNAEQATTDANGSQGLNPTLAAGVGVRTWTWTYNPDGQMLTADGPRTDVVDKTTYVYYPKTEGDLAKRGNLASVTNAAGHQVQVAAYNPHGQPTSITDPNGLVTTLTYDARARLIASTTSGKTTSYTYDLTGQLTRVTQPDGSVLNYTYDPAHRLIGVHDTLGNRIAYTLDSAGNRIKEESFDPQGVLTRTQSRTYDALNRLYQIVGAP